MAGESFFVSREDWSLHRKGELDQQRHQEKVREAIRDNLADLVADEALIMSDGQRVIRVPIRSLEEYRFRFDPNRQRHTGQGDGSSRPGDDLGPAGPPAPGAAGSRPGEQPGVDYYEAEVTVDELADMIFADLGLPGLKDKKKARLETDHIAFTDVRRSGLSGNLDKRRTLLEALRRNARAGRTAAHPIRRDDLRFKTWENRPREESNAVVFAMMDTSGSMGTFEKYIARSFYFWMVRFLRTRYRNVDIVFIAHDTQAREVDEKAFFSKGESGGTKCSSAYELALQIIDERYPPSDFNIYPFHFSDGDNYPSDNARCLKLAHELVRRVNAFGYGEIVGRGVYRDNTLMRVLERLTEPNVVRVSIKDRRDVYPALKAFFSGEEEPA